MSEMTATGKPRMDKAQAGKAHAGKAKAGAKGIGAKGTAGKAAPSRTFWHRWVQPLSSVMASHTPPLDVAEIEAAFAAID